MFVKYIGYYYTDDDCCPYSAIDRDHIHTYAAERASVEIEYKEWKCQLADVRSVWHRYLAYMEISCNVVCYVFNSSLFRCFDLNIIFFLDFDARLLNTIYIFL